MKPKTLFITVIAAAFIMGFNSCRKCDICTKDSEPEVRICENDYSSKTEYGLAIDTYEALGFDCH